MCFLPYVLMCEHRHTHTHFTLFMPIEKRKMAIWWRVAEGALTFSGLAPTFLVIFFMCPSDFRGVTTSVPSHYHQQEVL